MVSLAQSTALLKHLNLNLNLDAELFEELCGEHGHHFRGTPLRPGKTVKLFAWQMLAGNVPLDAVRHHAAGAFSASAFCQARQRLPLAAMQELSDRTAQMALAVMGASDGAEDMLWKGHRVFRIDGSSLSLSDTPELRQHFGCSGKCKPGCGYPTAHLLLLTGPAGVAMRAICSPLRTGDMTHARQTHECLEIGDLLMGDTLFGSFAHLQQLQSQGLHGLFPLHHSRKNAWGKGGNYGTHRRFVKKLGHQDQLVEYRKDHRPKWMSKKVFDEAPEWILVREVQRQATLGGVRRQVTVVTTLLDAKKYPAKALVRLLGERWGIETQLRWLKTTMGMERLHCQSVDGVKKELLMYLIVYNLLRLLIYDAALRQHVRPENISFADALARLRYGQGNDWVDLEIIPLRPGRLEPRVVKRRPKAYPKMNKPRAQLRQTLLFRTRNKPAA
jgi:hypothetical protein